MAWLLLALVSLGLCYSGVVWLSASNTYQYGKSAHQANENAIGIQLVNRALNAYRLDMRHRFQMALSLNALLNDEYEIRIAHGSVARVHEEAFSASPHHVAMLAIKAEWLMRTGQWGDELAGLIDELRGVTQHDVARELVEIYETHPRQ